MFLMELLFTPSAVSQVEADSGIQVHGSITVTGDIYTIQTDTSMFRAQRPPNLWRIIFSPTVQVSETIVLPFHIVLSSVETNVTTPRTGASSFMQFLLSPVNNLGLASFSPHIGWATFHLGSHAPQYSNLSAGDYQIFGVGSDLRPGRLRLSSSAGIVQRAIEPDSATGVPGAYARWIYLAKIGYGEEERSFVDANFIRLRDDPASIRRRSESLFPEEGIALTSNFRALIDENIFLTGEIGTCAFTRNMYSSEIRQQIGFLMPFIRQRISTRADYAGELYLHTNYPDWGVKGGVTYIGPGYIALGYPYLQSDRLEFILSPRVHFFERRLNFDGSIGHRTDNLLGTTGTKTAHTIGSVNVSAVPTDALSISMAYSNFGIRNNHSVDTLRIQNVARSVSISPSYSIASPGIHHFLSASALFDAYDEYNALTQTTTANRTRSLLIAYQANFLLFPLRANVSFQHFTNDAAAFGTEITSISFGGSYRFTDSKIVPSCAVSYATSKTASAGIVPQWNFRVGSTWNVARLLVSLLLQRNIVKHADERAGIGKTETLIQTVITLSF